jgi:acetolactate synthase-1/2/3 large subunit
MRNVRVADYIAQRVSAAGVKDVFMVTGGGAMHLDDALGLRDDLNLVFDHHEQACAIAAEGYARLTGRIGVVCVTSGPGGTNTITGVLGQWHDSVPVLYLSGQVRYDTTVASTGLPLRQLGDQEADIIRLVAPITKYAACVVEPSTIRYHLEKALWLATHGRPGPVWLDLPLNVQAAEIDVLGMTAFEPRELEETPELRGENGVSGAGATGGDERGRDNPRSHRLPAWLPVAAAAQAPGAFCGRFDHDAARAAARETLRRLREAERPVILAGSAVRSAGAHPRFLQLVEVLGVPVCTAWNAHDLVWEEHPLFAGRPGSLGERAGNFAVQNADVLLSLGCRLNVRQVGYEFRAFAHDAYRIVVDIDEAELVKPTIFPDLSVNADVGFFVDELLRLAVAETPPVHTDWLAWCVARRRRYPAVLPEFRLTDEPVNPYVFVEKLAARLDENDVVVCGNGSACVVPFQALAVKRGQRLIVNSGTAGMGYDLPAAIGAAFALRRDSGAGAPVSPGGRVICLAGDGSMQMNIQELQTIVHHGLPIKIFVFDNAGYASIRQTQDNLFDGRRVGEGPQSGVSFPDSVRLAEAYRMPARRVTRHDELGEAIGAALAAAGPVLVDVVMDPDQPFTPKVIAERLPDGRIVSKPLEDMFPFLDREEFAESMIVPPYDPERVRS